jgi:hypothetical protein
MNDATTPETKHRQLLIFKRYPSRSSGQVQFTTTFQWLKEIKSHPYPKTAIPSNIVFRDCNILHSTNRASNFVANLSVYTPQWHIMDLHPHRIGGEIHFGRRNFAIKFVENEKGAILGPQTTIQHPLFIAFFSKLKQPQVFLNLFEEDSAHCAPNSDKEGFEGLLVELLSHS